MKLDIHRFEKELNRLIKAGKITKDTAASYRSCIKNINDNCADVAGESIMSYFVGNLKSNDAFRKYLAAIRKYEDTVMKESKGILFGEPEIKLFSHFKGISPKGKNELKHHPTTLKRKINGLKNKKLKYALRLQLMSGLRVKEISELEPEDFTFKEGKIIIDVKSGKGQKQRKVEVIEDKYLYSELVPYIESYLKDGRKGRLFYSRSYLRKKAGEIDIRTHDLRRVNSQERVCIAIEKDGMSRAEAEKIAQRELGHEKIKTTRIYLRYKYPLAKEDKEVG